MDSNINTNFTRITDFSNNYSFTFFVLVLLVSLILFLRKRINQYTDRRNKLKDMAKNYERKRESRNDLRYHYYWALDRGEEKAALNIGKEIIELDKELKELYSEYQHYKEHGFHQLKKI